MCDYIVTFYTGYRKVLTTVILRDRAGLINDVICEIALKMLPKELQDKFCSQASQRYSVGRENFSEVA